MKRILKNILQNVLTCILCIALLAGSVSLPTQAAVTGGYTADEIVEVIMERLDAEIAKRPVARELEVDVSDMGIPSESVLWESAREILFDRVIYNNYNKTFFVNGTGSSTLRTDAGKVISDVHFIIDGDFREASTGNINWSKIDWFAELVDSEVEVAMTLLNEDMTIMEKALILQNFLCMDTVYACISFWHLPIGAFVNGGAKCAGYANAYATLLHAAGIECRVVISEEINHAWVMVRLEDGTWYHTDPTWDDRDGEGTVRYTYFLGGDEQYKEHHKSWDGIVPTAPKNNAFEGYAFDGLESILNYYNGDWYYLEPGFEQSYIVKTEFDGSNKERIPLNDMAVNMVGYKDKFYYNDSTQVYEYDIATGAKRLVYDITEEYPNKWIGQCVIKHQKQLVLIVADEWHENLAEIVIDLEPTEWESAFMSTDAIKLTESGETRQLEVTFVPFLAASFPGITWKSEDSSVASVNAEGLVTAVGEGTTNIIATITGGKEVGKCQVEVTYGIPITGYDILDETIVLNSPGEVYWIDSVFTPNEAADHENLIWESEDPSVARVDENGIVTAVYYGRTVITATTKDGAFSDSCEVLVDPDAAKGMVLSSQHVYMYQVGQTFQLTAEICPDTVTNERVAWSSSDNSVATVDENGLVTIVGGGECQIIATAVNAGFSRTCNIYAEIPDEWGVLPSQRIPATTVNLNIVKKEVTKKYETIQLAATVEPAEATHKMINWKSTNPSVAVVDSTGLVTVIGKGNCVITATTVDGSCSELCQISADWEDEEEEEDEEQLANVTAFVERMYTVALGREAEAEGVAHWVGLLKSGKSDGEDIAKGFFNGDEFLGRNLDNTEYLETLYATFFAREADEEGWNYNMGLLESGAGRADVLAVFINSGEFETLCGSYGIEAVYTQEEQVRSFVERMYTKALNREAEDEGVAHWVSLLLGGDSDAEDVAVGFFTGEEFLGRNLNDTEYLGILYATFFDREPDAEGWIYNMGLLQNHVDRSVVLNGFVVSTEFEALCDGYGIEAVYTRDEMVRSFVDRMYTKALGRAAEEDGASYWTNELLAGNTTGAEVADGFFSGEEFVNRGLSDREYVVTLYATFFNREAAEEDIEYWLSSIAASSRREAFIGFANSAEFGALCTRYEIRQGAVR